MAIFIIDQFSLNTDLPLDIRYLPNAGRLDPDISVYKYTGMQVFDTSTDSIWYADNSLNWVEVGSGSDASLNDLWNLVVDLSAYITNNIDASLTNLYQITNQLDASIQDLQGDIIRIDASLGNIDISLGILNNWNVSQDASIEDLRADHSALEASIARIDASIANIDLSLGVLNNWNVSQDASIDLINSNFAQIDASIARIDASIANIDLSLGVLNNWNVSQDASIEELRTDVGNLETSVGVLDGLIQTNITDISNLETSVGALDVLTQIHDDSIGAIEASLGDYVKKSGDTMTGALVITSGGLEVGSVGDPLDVSIYSNLYVHNNATIGGTLTVDGSLIVTNVETIDVSAAYIHLNTGLTGTPPESLQSGIVIGRGDADPYIFVYDESQQTFRIGIAGPSTGTGYVDSSTQAVATREDSPTVDGIAIWNDTAKRFDTTSNLTYNDTEGLILDTSLSLTALAGGSDLMLVVQPGGLVVAQTIPNYDASFNEIYGDITNIETSLGTLDGLIQTNITDISNLETSVGVLDGLIQTNITDISNLESSVGVLDGLIQTNITDITNLESSVGALDILTQILDSSIGTLDSSVTDLYDQLSTQDTSVKGAINIGDGSAGVYAGLTADGSLQFREFVGVGAATITENGNLIEVGIDASFGGEVNTASNIGTGEGLSVTKEGSDLPFKSIDTNDPSTVIITSDASTVYIDVSIAAISDASLVGLTDTSMNEANFVDHTNMEYDSAAGKWVETQNGWWDTSLGTTTDDLGGIPAGTDLEGKTLKEILYQILYEYQPPTLSTFTVPVSGTYEKGLASTQFSDVSVNWTTTNVNYPLALLNNLYITKTGSGTIFDTSLGLVASDTSVYTDNTGITNWGGTSRTITYNVTVDDNTTESQPAVGSSESFTFYYRQYWGMVAGNTNANQVDSDMIKGLIDSRLAGESTLNANFDNSTGGFVKYLFAYPDTVAAPDNFGTLSQIVDQNDFDITSSWDTENEDVSVGANNVRYRFYLAKNKVDTSDFDISFIF